MFEKHLCHPRGRGQIFTTRAFQRGGKMNSFCFTSSIKTSESNKKPFLDGTHSKCATSWRLKYFAKNWEKISRLSNYELCGRLQNSFAINTNSKFPSTASTNLLIKKGIEEMLKKEIIAPAQSEPEQFRSSVPVTPIILPKKSSGFQPVINRNSYVECNQKTLNSYVE